MHIRERSANTNHDDVCIFDFARGPGGRARVTAVTPHALGPHAHPTRATVTDTVYAPTAHTRHSTRHAGRNGNRKMQCVSSMLTASITGYFTQNLRAAGWD